MATNALPSAPSASAAANPAAPPNFYAQAASAQQNPPAAKPSPHAEDTAKFKAALPKLLMIFDKLETLKPNGMDISKEVKAMAQTLKDTRMKVFEGQDADEGDEAAQQAPAGAAPGTTPTAAPPSPTPLASAPGGTPA